MLRSCRSEAKQPATTLVMCVDMVKPLSIHTPRSHMMGLFLQSWSPHGDWDTCRDG